MSLDQLKGGEISEMLLNLGIVNAKLSGELLLVEIVRLFSGNPEHCHSKTEPMLGSKHHFRKPLQLVGISAFFFHLNRLEI